MLPEDLQRRMRFSNPEDNVSMRNRNYRWIQPTYEIKNIRRDAEDPNSSTVYYEDMRGNKYKTDAQMFVERFGDFYIESSLKHAIKLLAQAPGYDSPLPAVENTNPAAVDRSCPNCGHMAMGSEIGAAVENGETELKCCRCGLSINIAPDEKFLMAREKMSKLKNAIDKFGQFSPAEKVNFYEMGIPRQRVSQILGQMPLQGTYRITEDSILFENPEDATNIKTYLMTAKKKQAQWKEQIMDLSDELYFPTAPEGENITMRRIRELEEELGLDPLDLADMPGMEEDYLAHLEDEASNWLGQAKKAQSREDLDFPPELDPVEEKKHEKLVRDKLKREKEFYKKKDKEFERFKDKPLPMIGQVLESLKEETKGYDAEILDGMARCLFVTAWADYAEEQLGASFSGMELMDVAPETPPELFEKAKGLYNEIEETNNVNLSTFTPPGIDPAEGFDKGLFGHYLCMEALGHGVSWKDDHEDHGLKLPMIKSYADMDFSEATLRQMYEEFDKEFPEGEYLVESEEDKDLERGTL